MAIEFTLSFNGHAADESELDFYDVVQALEGFQRSLALTTHLVLNGTIITQAPSLKNAVIFVSPPFEGSWKIKAAVVGSLLGGAYHVGTAPKDTPLGHLVRSAYDYVIKESLGFHVDFDSTLGKQYEEMKKSLSHPKELSQARFDSLIEKCEVAIKEMHRPIVKSQTAQNATIVTDVGRGSPIGAILTSETYSYIAYTAQRPDRARHFGKVTSYNVNTFKGRIYVAQEGRPIPFELSETARGDNAVDAVTRSLVASARKNRDDYEISFSALQFESRTGRLKSFLITEVWT